MPVCYAFFSSHGPQRKPADEIALDECAEQQGGNDRHGKRGAGLAPQHAHGVTKRDAPTVTVVARLIVSINGNRNSFQVRGQALPGPR